MGIGGQSSPHLQSTVHAGVTSGVVTPSARGPSQADTAGPSDQLPPAAPKLAPFLARRATRATEEHHDGREAHSSKFEIERYSYLADLFLPLSDS